MTEYMTKKNEQLKIAMKLLKDLGLIERLKKKGADQSLESKKIIEEFGRYFKKTMKILSTPTDQDIFLAVQKIVTEEDKKKEKEKEKEKLGS